jgi:hypothetical protein
MGDDLAFSACMACHRGEERRGVCCLSLCSLSTTVANRRLPLSLCIPHQIISKKYTKHSKPRIIFVPSYQRRCSHRS